MRAEPGGGTRAVSHGASVTRCALDTSAVDAMCATQPAALATSGSELASVTIVAAICTRPIAGTATRLRSSPALVTRENADAETGRRTASTASEARMVATIHDNARARGSSAAPRRAPSTRAAVAPNVSRNPGSPTSSGRTIRITAAASAAACQTGVRWSMARAAKYAMAISVARHTDGPAVTTAANATSTAMVSTRRSTSADSAEGEQAAHRRGDNRDVAAGDRDDVIRAGRLQRASRVVRQPRAIADEDRRRDGRRHRIMWSHPRREGSSDVRTNVRRALVDRPACRDEVHEQRALDRTEQRGAVEREPALEVRHTVVQESRRTPERDRRLDGAARPPREHTVERGGPANADRDRALDRLPDATDRQRADLRAQRHVAVARRGILGQQRPSENRIVVAFGSEARDVESTDLSIEQLAKRRMKRLLGGSIGKHHAAGPEAEHERGGCESRRASMPRDRTGHDHHRKQPDEQARQTAKRRRTQRAANDRQPRKQSDDAHDRTHASGGLARLVPGSVTYDEWWQFSKIGPAANAQILRRGR